MGSPCRVGVHILLHRDDVVVVIGDVVEDGHLALHILQLLSGEAEGVSTEEVFATHLTQIALCGFLRAPVCIGFAEEYTVDGLEERGVIRRVAEEELYLYGRSLACYLIVEVGRGDHDGVPV